MDTVDCFSNRSLPIIGICLGMQIINEYFEGETILSNFPSHGHQSLIQHDGDICYQNIPSSFLAMRYNSLKCEINSEELRVNAWLENENNEPMSIIHKKKKIIGLQYHPESFFNSIRGENFCQSTP